MEDIKQPPVINLTPVESSQIHAIGHDPESNTLAIQFKSKGGPGAVYHYANFPTEKFAAFSGSGSIGSYFGQNIKNATTEHPFTRIG